MKHLPFLFILALVHATMASDDEDTRRRLYLYFEGREVYQSQCMDCHGQTGKGDGPWSEDLTKDRPRNFRRGVFKFRSTPMGYLPTDSDLKRTIRSGVSGTAMPTFRNLPYQKLEAVIAYIKTFSRAWKDSSKVGKAVELPSRPDWMRQPGAQVDSGKALFALHCAACHGSQGQGDGPASKALVDVWGYPIQPANLNAPHYKSGRQPEDWFRTIAMGLDGTPMVGFRPTLTDEQIWDLVAYLSELKTTP